MTDRNGCECDYSYICHQCQLRIDAENQAQYLEELRDWTTASIKLIAEKLNVEIPEPPRKRGVYDGY